MVGAGGRWGLAVLLVALVGAGCGSETPGGEEISVGNVGLTPGDKDEISPDDGDEPSPGNGDEPSPGNGDEPSPGDGDVTAPGDTEKSADGEVSDGEEKALEGSETPPDDGDVTDPGDDDVHPAVKSYAREFSLSLTEARRHLDRIDPVQGILLSIMRLEASRVAGSSIDHGAGFMGWVWLVGDQPPGEEAARIADAHDDVEIRVGAEHTYTELEAAQQRLSSDLFNKAIGDPETATKISDMIMYLGIDHETNSLSLGLDPAAGTSGSASDEELKAAGEWLIDFLQDHVEVSIVTDDARGMGPG